MQRRMTARNSFILAMLAAAAVSVSCGGGVEGDSLTGVSTLPTATDEAEMGEVLASGKKASSNKKELVCHKGKDKRVPASAVAGHVRHGDTVGGCASPCPCFSAQQILGTAAACESGATTQCLIGSGTGIVCDGTSTNFFVSGNTCTGPLGSVVVTPPEYDACLAIVNTCPDFDL